MERAGPRGPRRLAGRRAHRDRPAAGGARRLDRGRAAGAPSPPTPRRWTASCPALSAALGTELPGVVERSRRRRSGRLGPGQHRRRSRRSSASSRRTCSTRSCPPAAAWPRRRWPWPTAGSRPASSGSCSGSWASASSASTTSRCCRRRPTPGRLLFVEENIRGTAPRPGRAGRPVPDLDRAPRDDPRLRVRGASLAAAVPRVAARAAADAVRRATRRGWAARRCAGSAARSAARPAASTGWSG